MDTSSNTVKVTPVYVITSDTSSQQQHPTTTSSQTQPMQSSEPQRTAGMAAPSMTASETSSTPVGQVQSTPGGSLFRQSEIPMSGDTSQPSYTQGGVAPGSSPDMGPQGVSSEGTPLRQREGWNPMGGNVAQGGMGSYDQSTGRAPPLDTDSAAAPMGEPSTQYTSGSTFPSQDVRTREPSPYQSTAPTYPPSSTTPGEPMDVMGKGISGTGAEGQVTSSQYDQRSAQNGGLGTGTTDSSGARGTHKRADLGLGWSSDNGRTGERDPMGMTGSQAATDTGAGGGTMAYSSDQRPQYSTTTDTDAAPTTQSGGFDPDQTRPYNTGMGTGPGGLQYGTDPGSGQRNHTGTGTGIGTGTGAGLASTQPGTTGLERQFMGAGLGSTQTPATGAQAPCGVQGLGGVPYPAPAQPRKVMVLVDETSDSDNTVGWFASTSILPNDQIVLLHIHAEKTTDIERKKVGTTMSFQRYLSFFTQRGLSANQLSTHVIPARRESLSTMGQALSKYLEATPADLLVMGHSEPTMTQKLVGAKAFSEYAVHHIDVPLLLVQKPKLKN